MTPELETAAATVQKLTRQKSVHGRGLASSLSFEAWIFRPLAWRLVVLVLWRPILHQQQHSSSCLVVEFCPIIVLYLVVLKLFQRCNHTSCTLFPGSFQLWIVLLVSSLVARSHVHIAHQLRFVHPISSGLCISASAPLIMASSPFSPSSSA